MLKSQGSAPVRCAFDVQFTVPENVFNPGSRWLSSVQHEFGDLSFRVELETLQQEIYEDDARSDRPVEKKLVSLAATAFCSMERGRCNHLFTGNVPPPHECHLKVQCLQNDCFLGVIDEQAELPYFSESFVHIFPCSTYGAPAYSLQDLREIGLLGVSGVLCFRIEAIMDTLPEPLISDSLGPDDMLRDMWREQRFTDFAIVSLGGNEIRCHRSVLVAASPVFKGMICGEMQEVQQQFATVDESPEVVEALLEFVYTGKLQVKADCCMLVSLLQLSDYFQLPDLARLCAQRITPLMSADNVVHILQRLARLRNANPFLEDLFQLAIKSVRQDTTLASQCTAVLAHQTMRSDMRPKTGPEGNSIQSRHGDDGDNHENDEDSDDDGSVTLMSVNCSSELSVSL